MKLIKIVERASCIKYLIDRNDGTFQVDICKRDFSACDDTYSYFDSQVFSSLEDAEKFSENLITLNKG